MHKKAKKGQLILHALGNVGFLESEKKNCIRQGVMKMKNDAGDWRKTFILLKVVLCLHFVLLFEQESKN
jgi:hypothetical protein